MQATQDAADRRHRAHRALLRAAAMALLGYAFTRSSLLFSVNPLPGALLIAVPDALFPALLGVLFGIWQGAPHPSVTLIMLLIGWGLRAYLRLYAYPAGAAHAAERQTYRSTVLTRIRTIARTLWRGTNADGSSTATSIAPSAPVLPVSLRTLCAAAGGIGGAVLHCIRGGFAYYDLYGAVLLLFLTPIACALLCFALDTPHGKPHPLRPLLGQAFLICALGVCLRTTFFFGISLAIAPLLALALYLAPRRGYFISLGALLLGCLAVDVSVLPPLALCVLIYAPLHRVAPFLALPCASIAALVAALAGGTTFFWQIAPSIAVGTLACGIQQRLNERAPSILSQAPPLYRHDSAFSSLREESARVEHLHAHLCAMSGAFGGLCEVLLHMSDRMRHSQPPMGDPPHTEAFAKDCSVMAALLRDALSEDAHTMHTDDARAEQLGRALRREEITVRQIVYLVDKERCRIELYGCAHAKDASMQQQLHRLLEKETALPLRLPVYDSNAPEDGLLMLQSRPRLSMQCIFRSLAAGTPLTSEAPLEGKTTTKKAPGCGDSVRFFADGQDHFYALLCDGMGSGEEAALTSGVSVLLLERMLRAGVGVDTAMTMLNHYLFSRVGERSETTTTVDLLTIDLYNGKARFIKSGAADTLLLRDEQLYVIGCRTFPLGALSGVDVQVIPFSLRAGDCILMMSDGVADVLQDGAPLPLHTTQEELSPLHTSTAQGWLHELLRAPLPTDLSAIQQLLERILHTARQHGSVDDMTVALLRVQGEG